MAERDDAVTLPETLEAAPLELRRARPAFASAVFEAIDESAHELRDWLSWAQSPPSIERSRLALSDGEAAFDANTMWNYIVFETATSLVVGGAGLHRRNAPDDLEIGYWVRTSCAGRGIATAAARALTRAAFDYLPWVQSVTIKMDQSNAASVKVPRKLGFEFVREEVRPIVTARHTGRGYVWMVHRDAWRSS